MYKDVEVHIYYTSRIKIDSAGCDTTQRRPEDDDGKTWRIGPSDPNVINLDPMQDDIRSQQRKEHETE